MFALFCAWASLFAVYLVLVGGVAADEMVAGACCALAGMFWWVGVRRVSQHTFAFDSGALNAVGRACRQWPRATLTTAVVLLRALVRDETGKVDRRFYAHGKAIDSADSGRRAVGVLAASLAPDSFVLRTPVDRDEIVVHDFVGGKPSMDPRWPI